MATQQQLRDSGGRLIGTIITRSDGKQEIRNPGGQLKGTFDPKQNQTRDAGGRLVGTGNLLVSLL
jgi:hypothetical protein